MWLVPLGNALQGFRSPLLVLAIRVKSNLFAEWFKAKCDESIGCDNWSGQFHTELGFGAWQRSFRQVQRRGVRDMHDLP